MMLLGRAGARWVVLLALLLFGLTHRHAFELTGFSDDLGLLADLTQRAANSQLLGEARAKWSAPLWPGSAMWRPWSYGSFAFDAALWGYAPGFWRITNLLLHIAAAALAGLATQRLLGQRFAEPAHEHARAGAAAFAIFLLAPWTPEVTLWLAGRFDGWAAFGVVLALWSALRSRGADRWLVLSLAAGLLALTSKESALLLPAWLLLIAAFQRAWRSSTAQRGFSTFESTVPPLAWALAVAHMLLATLTFAWRSKVVAGSAVAVYGQTPLTSPLELLPRLLAQLGFAGGLVPLAPIAAWTAVLAAIALAALALVRARTVALAGLAMAASVPAALALYFATPPGANEGYRLYYLATPGVAIALACALRTGTRAARAATSALLLVLMLASAWWQGRVADEWTNASRQIAHAALATRNTLATLPATDYGLLLLPDSAGRVPMLRNAQGALLPALPGGGRMLDRIVVFTPPQFAEWQGHLREDIVRKLTTRADAPPKPTRYFCHSMRSAQLVDLGYWPPDAPGWEARWRKGVADAGCTI